MRVIFDVSEGKVTFFIRIKMPNIYCTGAWPRGGLSITVTRPRPVNALLGGAG
jgi:hypothetical protein